LTGADVLKRVAARVFETEKTARDYVGIHNALHDTAR
jgi:hypothetical protein